jgi:ubiquinone/menaquinone biosynthesis C-methylase UbiE
VLFRSERYPKYIKLPYNYFESQIIEYSKNSKSLIDICCGDGIHSFVATELLDEVVGIDFSDKSIELCNEIKKKKCCSNITFYSKNVLEYQIKNKFDIVIMAGSLSYFNHSEILNKLYDLLNENGILIIVDSLNDNIFYRFNRFINYIKGSRTFFTVSNIPYFSDLTNEINKNFKIIKIKNFGIFIFLTPLLKLFLNDDRIAKYMTILDSKFQFLNKYSFKSVIVAQKNVK